MHVLVTGSTGYIGGRLVPGLLAAGHRVRCVVRTPAKVGAQSWEDEVDVVEGDLTDADSIARAMEGIDAAYFLVHSMGGEEDFAARDREVAATFRDAAAKAGVSRIVYLGGLGRDDDPNLSPHLESRHEVGRVLADGPVAVTELRAAIIIGSGSASFEMLRSLVEILPAMIAPRWIKNRCHPIAIGDVLTYLVRVLDVDATAGRVLEIGGAEVLDYAHIMQAYARATGLRRRVIVPVPLLTPSLSSLWIGLVTPLPADLARPLVESLINEVVVRDRPITAFVDHQPMGLDQALALAVERVADDDAIMARSGRATAARRTVADPHPADPDWAGGVVLTKVEEVTLDAPTGEVFAAVEGIESALGGLGFRPRRTGGVTAARPHRMRVGDAIGRWRVEAIEAPSQLRVQADLRLPGEAWLEWRVTDDGGRTRLQQRALFHPAGVLGRAFWYAAAPARRLVDRRLLKAIAASVETGAPVATGDPVDAGARAGSREMTSPG